MDEKISSAGPRTWMDSLGTTVSIACAIQCTLFPLLIGMLPLMGLGFLAGDGVEKVFIVTSIVLAAGSFIWGFRYHRRFYIFLFLVSGLFLIFTGRVWVADGFEMPVVVSGALALTSGHLLNRRLCRLCVACAHVMNKSPESRMTRFNVERDLEQSEQVAHFPKEE